MDDKGAQGGFLKLYYSGHLDLFAFTLFTLLFLVSIFVDFVLFCVFLSFDLFLWEIIDQIRIQLCKFNAHTQRNIADFDELLIVLITMCGTRHSSFRSLNSKVISQIA